MNTLGNLNQKINKNYINQAPASNKLNKSSRLNKILANKAEILETITSPCGLAEDILNDYVDCELDLSTRERVEEHLCTCTYCKETVNELMFLKASAGILSSNKKVLNIGIKERLREALNNELGINLSNESYKKY